MLSRDAARHAKVLRLGPGDPIVLFDGRGRRASGRIESLVEGTVVCQVGPPTAEAAEAGTPRLHLVQALPKGSKLDDIVRIATELGVAGIHLVSSRNVVVRLDDERGDRRRERLLRIAVEAARQCERDDVPDLTGPEPLFDAVRRAPAEALRLVACGRSGRPLGDDVGPEGGLAAEEVEALVGLGFRAVSFGSTVLRVETAVPVVLGVVADRLRSNA